MNNEELEVLQTANEYINNVQKAIPEIIENYRNGQEVQASEKMILLIEGLQWLDEVIRLTQEHTSIDREDSISLYQEILEAMENGDIILLSDLMEYELIPILSLWKEQFEETLKNNIN